MATPNAISMEVLIDALSSLESARNELLFSASPGAYSAYLSALQSGSRLRTAMGLLPEVEILPKAEIKTANPSRMAV